MCLISSFVSECVDQHEIEREESVAMTEEYNYIKTLPPKQKKMMVSLAGKGRICTSDTVLTVHAMP